MRRFPIGGTRLREPPLELRHAARELSKGTAPDDLAIRLEQEESEAGISFLARVQSMHLVTGVAASELGAELPNQRGILRIIGSGRSTTGRVRDSRITSGTSRNQR